jgi:hypothetical protein
MRHPARSGAIRAQLVFAAAIIWITRCVYSLRVAAHDARQPKLAIDPIDEVHAFVERHVRVKQNLMATLDFAHRRTHLKITGVEIDNVNDVVRDMVLKPSAVEAELGHVWSVGERRIAIHPLAEFDQRQL